MRLNGDYLEVGDSSRRSFGAENNPLVSVVITTFNHARFLEEALASVASQTYEDLEVLVVDDGSTDETPRIIAKWKEIDPRVRALRHPNQGQRRSFIRGLNESSGDVVCALDADDRFHPRKVEKAVTALVRHPEVTQVTNQRQIIDEFGRDRTTRHFRLPSGDVRGPLLRWGRYNSIATSCLTYPRWVLEEVVRDTFWWSDSVWDHYAMVGAAFLGPVLGLDEVLTDYRVHGQNAHHDVERNLVWREAIVEAVNHWAERAGLTDRLEPTDDLELVLLSRYGREPASAADRWRSVLRTLPESWDLGRGPVDAGLTLLARAVMAVSAEEGRHVVAEGPARYALQLRRRMRL